MEVRKDLEKPAIGIGFNAVVKKSDIPLYQEVGLKHDVRVRTIADEGQPYTHYSTDRQSGQRIVYNGSVEEGKTYIKILSSRENLRDFWKELREKQKERTPA